MKEGRFFEIIDLSKNDYFDIIWQINFMDHIGS